MNPKLIMITSALLLGIAGIGFTFLSQEASKSLNIETNQLSILFFQILGALYLSFAILNWMSKNIIIGAIYGKPLIIGNLIHFLVGALALIKILPNTEANFKFILVLTLLYSVMACSFGYLMLSNPKVVNKGI